MKFIWKNHDWYIFIYVSDKCVLIKRWVKLEPFKVPSSYKFIIKNVLLIMLIQSFSCLFVIYKNYKIFNVNAETRRIYSLMFIEHV